MPKISSIRTFPLVSVTQFKIFPMDLYYHPISPPCWSVLLLGRELNLTFNLKVIDNSVQGAEREAFVKLNPQHQVPTLVDGGDFAIGESRAILSYLMDAHAGSDDHPLYPRNPKGRALIQHRLNFDLGMLYRRAYDYFSPIWRTGSIGTDVEMEKLMEALGFFEEYLNRNQYAAGDRLTIADLSLIATVSFLDVCRFELEKFPKVSTWYERCRRELKGYRELVEDQFADARQFIEQFR